VGFFFPRQGLQYELFDVEQGCLNRVMAFGMYFFLWNSPTTTSNTDA
jgi:hypothetical protein